jgi:lipopolysaccharide/colanic/teichoic acid biosynthesis glycosyltransferase
MGRRIFDIVVALAALVACGPVIAVAAVLVRASSSGSAFYKSTRVGRFGRPFTMYKLRTMHVRNNNGSSITSADDSRVFAVGRVLRALKVDELPQLWNIVKGDMSIVGPRPEAPDIVDKYYSDEYRRTLDVRPGLTSPGSICYYQFGEQQLREGSAEDYYVTQLLPAKMKQDLEWVRTTNFLTDICVIARTATVLITKLAVRSSH